MGKKVLFVATVVKTHIMQFHIPFLKMFKDEGWETAVAARNDYENPTDCCIPHCDTYFNVAFERNPLNPKNIGAYYRLKKLIDEGRYDIIHCHTPVGGVLGRLAARDARKKGCKVIYTAHGFHFYKGAPLVNWMLYYPVERFLTRFTDVLITINKEDFKRAQNFKAGKVEYVPGVGIDTDNFCINENKRQEKRRGLGVAEDAFVLLSVGELIARKNHSVVIDALGELEKTGKLGNIQYLICGSGVKREELIVKVRNLGLSEKVNFLGYRKDIKDICNASDIFVFMSVHEGLPVALMEAMASGLPVICSDIRGNTDLIENGVSGEIIKSTPTELAETIVKLRMDRQLREKYVREARNIIEAYDIKNVHSIMRSIYGFK